ncbi:MAG: DUF2442 domain-containing protein [Gemmatimonadetes bacterium]|nr:DUF2442 domain-containing protein [Gemmatimonadota bacterium]
MDIPSLSDEEILAQYDAACEAARVADLTEPRAKAAFYDPATGRIVVELKRGSAFAFPPALLKELAKRTPEELARVEVDPSGEALSWEEFDIDISVPGILVAILGDSMLKAFASRGGSSKSERKAAAARENGRKGGRPRKKRPVKEPAGT